MLDPASGAVGAEICGASTGGLAGADEVASFDGGGGVLESLDFELSELLELSDFLELLWREEREFKSLAAATRLCPDAFVLLEFESSPDWPPDCATVASVGAVAAAGASGGLAAGAPGAGAA
ncbi:MAG TPA: hypothetical protein VGL28_09780 [Steroidobacteraceae bacterium]